MIKYIKKKFLSILANIAAAFTFFFGLFLLLSGIYVETQKVWYGWYLKIISIVGLLISMSDPVNLTLGLNQDYKPSCRVLEVLKVLENKKEIGDKIKERSLYRKWPGSDTWACQSCDDSGDKFYMVRHPCRRNKK